MRGLRMEKTSATVPEEFSLRLPLSHTWTGISLSLSSHLLNRQLNSIRARPFKLTNLRFNLIKIHFQTMISRAPSLWRSFFDYKKSRLKRMYRRVSGGIYLGAVFTSTTLWAFLNESQFHARDSFWSPLGRVHGPSEMKESSWKLKVNKQIKRENQQFDISKPSASAQVWGFLPFSFESP